MSKENRGYIIFNADGTKPKTTLAALEAEDGVQIIAEGTGGDEIMLFGSIAQALHEHGVDKELLRATIDEAISLGDTWLGFMKFAKATAGKLKEKGIKPETPEDLEGIDFAELFDFDDE